MTTLINNRPYSEKWDTLLNKILDEGVPETNQASKCTLDYTLVTGTKDVYSWFGLVKKEVSIIKSYSIWIANKDIYYGRLRRVDGFDVPDILEFSPSKETMLKLYKAELRELDKCNFYD